MTFGYFDIAVLGLLVVLNIIFWKKRLTYRVGCFGGILIFGVILPLISQRLEINRVSGAGAEYDDAKMLYTYFIFVVYWLIGACQIAIISRKYGKDENRKEP